eukprot:484292-Hanusia_phi.AAC.1
MSSPARPPTSSPAPPSVPAENTGGGSRATEATAVSFKPNRKRSIASLTPEELEARVEAAKAQGKAELLDLQEKARLSAEELRGELAASFQCCKKKCASAVPVDEACKQRYDR